MHRKYILGNNLRGCLNVPTTLQFLCINLHETNILADKLIGPWPVPVLVDTSNYPHRLCIYSDPRSIVVIGQYAMGGKVYTRAL